MKETNTWWILLLLGLLSSVTASESNEVVVPARSTVDVWAPAVSAREPSVQDLHREYYNVFRHGNRNAASHRWSTFLLERASQMSIERLEYYFSGFCAVSGSPVRPSDYNRYRLTLPKIGDSTEKNKAAVVEEDEEPGQQEQQQQNVYATGFMHYCCWPCVCDTQDFIRVDTLNFTSSDGVTRQRHFAVIGNPCDHPEQLDIPFHQPFGYGTTTIAQTAPEVRCNKEDGTLEGATVSDHGYIIISMFFDALETNELHPALDPPTPGRVSSEMVGDNSIIFQDEREWVDFCTDRAANGYNSGMGEIFRQVSAISPINTETTWEITGGPDSSSTGESAAVEA